VLAYVEHLGLAKGAQDARLLLRLSIVPTNRLTPFVAEILSGGPEGGLPGGHRCSLDS